MKLKKGTVFDQLIECIRSRNNPSECLPSKIIFDGSTYNLTDAYKEFWDSVYDKHTTGHKVKLLRSDLAYEDLVAIGQVLKRGWEDERFLPTCLAQPLLEASIFNKSYENCSLTYKMFFKYVEPNELELIKTANEGKIDAICLDIFKKYHPAISDLVGYNVKEACAKVLLEMITLRHNTDNRTVWARILSKMDINIDQFQFVYDQTKNLVLRIDYPDLERGAPHNMWGTFLYGWDRKLKHFYYKILENRCFEMCKFCNSKDIDSKHILANCRKDNHLNTLFIKWDHLNKFLKERHAEVLQILVDKLNSAYKDKPNWDIVEKHKNNQSWPKELEMLEDLALQPSIVIYTTKSDKKAFAYYIMGHLGEQQSVEM